MDWLTLEEEGPFHKKMWKGFTSTLQSKLRRLGKSKALIKTTRHLLDRLPSSNRRCHHSHHHVYFHYHHHYDNQGLKTQSSLPNTQVGELLPGPGPFSVNHRYLYPQAETEPYKEVEAKTALLTALPHQQQPRNMETAEDDEDDLKDAEEYDDGLADDEDETEYALVETPDSKTLLLHGLNAKSENFIRDFHERLRLERQRSIEEFYEMLNRGC